MKAEMDDQTVSYMKYIAITPIEIPGVKLSPVETSHMRLLYHSSISTKPCMHSSFMELIFIIANMH